MYAHLAHAQRSPESLGGAQGANSGHAWAPHHSATWQPRRLMCQRWRRLTREAAFGQSTCRLESTSNEGERGG